MNESQSEPAIRRRFHSAVCSLQSAFILLILAAVPAQAAADCFTIEEASAHIGQMACVTGKVMKVAESRSTWFLDFCSNYRRCPFTVVIFKNDIKDEALLKQFPGKVIRIYGPIQEYNGRAEIILKLEEQLSGEPGPYADKLKPREPKDRRAPTHPGSGVPKNPY